MLIVSVAVNCRVHATSEEGCGLYAPQPLIAHSGRAALSCYLRLKLLMPAQYAERDSSPAEVFTRLPNRLSCERELLLGQPIS